MNNQNLSPRARGRPIYGTNINCERKYIKFEIYMYLNMNKLMILVMMAIMMVVVMVMMVLMVTMTTLMMMKDRKSLSRAAGFLLHYV